MGGRQKGQGDRLRSCPPAFGLPLYLAAPITLALLLRRRALLTVAYLGIAELAGRSVLHSEVKGEGAQRP